MKLFVDREVTQKYLQKIFCDICKAETNHYKEWKMDDYGYQKAEIKIVYDESAGDQYGGYGSRIEVDLCPQCFKSKLIPFLEQNGVKVTETEYDW